MPTLSPQVTPYYGGGQVVNPSNVLQIDTSPSSVFTQDKIGTLAVDYVAGNIYGLASKSGGVNTWVLLGGSAGAIASVLGTANQITANTVGNIVTLSLPAAITAPGSLTTTTTLNATTTITAGTGITATTGNIAASSGNVSASGTVTAGTGITSTTGNIVASAGNITATLGSMSAGTSVTAGTTVTATLGAITATNGNFVGSTAGTGLLLNSPSASGVAASPVVVNGRSGQATFTTVSIAAAADLTLTITNSEITGASTQVIYSMSGATTGAALSIKSVTNTAGSSAIVVTNGTGATTTTADIVMNFIVLN